MVAIFNRVHTITKQNTKIGFYTRLHLIEQTKTLADKEEVESGLVSSGVQSGSKSLLEGDRSY